MADIAELKRIASQVRRDIIRQVHKVNSGHPGGSLGCADFLVALYFSVMKHEASFNMNAANEDVFFLSCLLYTSPSPRDATLSRMPSSA